MLHCNFPPGGIYEHHLCLLWLLSQYHVTLVATLCAKIEPMKGIEDRQITKDIIGAPNPAIPEVSNFGFLGHIKLFKVLDWDLFRCN